ncbi:MAG TPA: SUMF1/EgtB/PvdO family nonheme iron enzyme [Bacillota bacterium]|nr:SUMF1/EgtB/PvdO family nonheme iron enzyme [Bacillota bacterium]HOY89050.1 SUMF1/EgtB/PvdO family nonheme iron enzyme [Bacillota bacterium]HPM63328.1 SUMF1/EgtB/PvdO family nonheme iron enzyme [Bacillota bacterium]HQJ24232.1 SUMF1/EgtB/PvdO family nonheme iron enzyme [Bacillota bacterium]
MWCGDWYGAYDGDSQTDPQGPSTGSYRVIRGSSWGSTSKGCRSACREYDTSTFTYYDLGFRLVRTL